MFFEEEEEIVSRNSYKISISQNHINNCVESSKNIFAEETIKSKSTRITKQKEKNKKFKKIYSSLKCKDSIIESQIQLLDSTFSLRELDQNINLDKLEKFIKPCIILESDNKFEYNSKEIKFIGKVVHDNGYEEDGILISSNYVLISNIITKRMDNNFYRNSIFLINQINGHFSDCSFFKNVYFRDENDQFCIIILDEPLGLKYGCALINPDPNIYALNGPLFVVNEKLINEIILIDDRSEVKSMISSFKNNSYYNYDKDSLDKNKSENDNVSECSEISLYYKPIEPKLSLKTEYRNNYGFVLRNDDKNENKNNNENEIYDFSEMPVKLKKIREIDYERFETLNIKDKISYRELKLYDLCDDDSLVAKIRPNISRNEFGEFVVPKNHFQLTINRIKFKFEHFSFNNAKTFLNRFVLTRCNDKYMLIGTNFLQENSNGLVLIYKNEKFLQDIFRNGRLMLPLYDYFIEFKADTNSGNKVNLFRESICLFPFIRYFNNILSLTLSDNSISEKQLEYILSNCRFLSLTEFTLNSDNINDKCMELLSKFNLPNLIFLSINSIGFTDNGIKSLIQSDFRNLDKLFLLNDNISDEGIVNLTKCNFKMLTDLLLRSNCLIIYKNDEIAKKFLKSYFKKLQFYSNLIQ